MSTLLITLLIGQTAEFLSELILDRFHLLHCPLKLLALLDLSLILLLGCIQFATQLFTLLPELTNLVLQTLCILFVLLLQESLFLLEFFDSQT